MSIAPSSWRTALPRIGLSEASDLPTERLAALLAASGARVFALEAYREVLEISPQDATVLGAFAVLLGRLGRDDEELAIRTRLAAIMVVKMGLPLEEHEAAIAFELATLGLGSTPAKMPSGYLAALFDAHAEGFERSLRGDLHYRTPELLYACLVRALQSTTELSICDVGCGTGLLAPLLRPHARRLDGVDRSPRMLDKARAGGMYDELTAADLAPTLAARASTYDVVTAADVFVYVGDLAPALQASSAALRTNGILAFTVESACEEGYRLTPSGRYTHAPAYVREAFRAAGLCEVSADHVILRAEQGRGVAGTVWVLRRDT